MAHINITCLRDLWIEKGQFKQVIPNTAKLPHNVLSRETTGAEITHHNLILLI